MRLLLDSSGYGLVVALADSQGVILEQFHENGTPLSRDIGSAAGAVLGELSVSDLEQIVVGTGPGSFIGTRMAISYANGLATAGGGGVVGVNSLGAVASVYGSGRAAVLRDARRNEVYLYFPRGTSGPLCEITKLTGLEAKLRQLNIQRVIIEVPAPTKAGTTPICMVRQAAIDTGVEVVACNSVPAEGLRRAGSLGQSAPYVEPVYLRGFL